jgi:two-component system, LytTR family, response regulator
MTGTFTINTHTGIFFIEPSSIVRCQASSNYTKLFFANAKSLIVAKTLRQWQNDLPCENFVRIHQSHLINKKFVEKIIANEVVLTNGSTVNISRRKVSAVKKQLQLK